jgi:hypothetical protein
MSSEPFSASRTALVASTAVSDTPFKVARRAKSFIASTATRIRTSSILPVFSTPKPKRAEIFSPRHRQDHAVFYLADQ